MGGSDQTGQMCPPAVVYSRSDGSIVAAETLALSLGAMNIEWLRDYAVIQEQARACSGG